MKQVTVRALRWPYAVLALMMLPVFVAPVSVGLYTEITCKLDDLRCASASWAAMPSLVALATVLFVFWSYLFIVPAIWPNRLILNSTGVILETAWSRQRWIWAEVIGLWSLGGYKPQLEVMGSPDGAARRVFLGSHWPGDTVGLAQIISTYRNEASG